MKSKTNGALFEKVIFLNIQNVNIIQYTIVLFKVNGNVLECIRLFIS